jgi:hypothetical protein
MSAACSDHVREGSFRLAEVEEAGDEENSGQKNGGQKAGPIQYRLAAEKRPAEAIDDSYHWI